jgi:hypothetical protein
LLVVEITPSEGERGFKWVFHPAKAVSPRTDPSFNKPPPAGYTENPPAQLHTSGDVTLSVQPLHAGGEHVTAWREVTRGSVRTLYNVRRVVASDEDRCGAGPSRCAHCRSVGVACS